MGENIEKNKYNTAGVIIRKPIPIYACFKKKVLRF